MAAMDSSAAQTRLLRRAQIRGKHGVAQWRVWKVRVVLSFGTEVLSVWTPTAKQIENDRRAWMVAWAVAYSM